MSEKKNILKSIRLSETVFCYIDDFEGNGFNQKFENLIMYCMTALPNLNDRITERREELDKLEKDIQSAKYLLDKLKGIEWCINKAAAYQNEIKCFAEGV